MDKVVIVLLLIIVILVSIYVINLYNKLVDNRCQVNKLWDQLRIAINKQFDFIEANINSIKGGEAKEIKALCDKFKTTAYTETVMDLYLNLEKIMSNIDSPLSKSFNDMDEKINEVKATYNNVLLRYNDLIKFMPNALVAKIFKFKPGIYFRSN